MIEFERIRIQDAFSSVQMLTTQKGALMPEPTEEFRAANPYDENHRTQFANALDELLPRIMEWHTNPMNEYVSGMSFKERHKFLKNAKKFFLDKKGRLYHKKYDNLDRPQLVVDREDRMYMLHCAHDNLGHKGAFATQAFIEEQFWWPDLQRDVQWYVKSCKACQNKQLRLI